MLLHLLYDNNNLLQIYYHIYPTITVSAQIRTIMSLFATTYWHFSYPLASGPIRYIGQWIRKMRNYVFACLQLHLAHVHVYRVV